VSVTLRSFGPTENVVPQDDILTHLQIETAVAELMKEIGRK